MLMTKEEADEKDCPYADVTCVSDSCMAWRWSKKVRTESGSIVEEAPVNGMGYSEEVTRLGYCGLCGKPEVEE